MPAFGPDGGRGRLNFVCVGVWQRACGYSIDLREGVCGVCGKGHVARVRLFSSVALCVCM